MIIQYPHLYISYILDGLKYTQECVLYITAFICQDVLNKYSKRKSFFFCLGKLIGIYLTYYTKAIIKTYYIFKIAKAD